MHTGILNISTRVVILREYGTLSHSNMPSHRDGFQRATRPAIYLHVVTQLPVALVDTAFCKSFVTNKWHKFNDENVTTISDYEVKVKFVTVNYSQLFVSICFLNLFPFVVNSRVRPVLLYDRCKENLKQVSYVVTPSTGAPTCTLSVNHPHVSVVGATPTQRAILICLDAYFSRLGNCDAYYLLWRHFVQNGEPPYFSFYSLACKWHLWAILKQMGYHLMSTIPIR